MGNAPLLQGSPFRTADALAEVAVRHHGSAFLARGGAVGRARAEVAKGLEPEQAAAVAAKWGKGHTAELRLASEHSLDAALRDLPFLTRPNPCANDRHADLQVLERRRIADTVQVGVGSAAYLRKKAMNSQAGQVVVPSEVKSALCEARDPACARVSDRVRFKGTSSNALSAEVIVEEAHEILLREILDRPAVPEWMKWGIAAGSGVASAADAFATNLLFETVERLWHGRAFDGTMVEPALLGAGRAGIRSALSTYFQVEEFLARARQAFNARILAKVGNGVVWAGAIADVVVSTAVEVWRWLKSQISFEELLRRAGVHVFTAAGGALGAFGALVVLRGAPGCVQVVGVLAAAWGGSAIARAIGDDVFASNWNAIPALAP